VFIPLRTNRPPRRRPIVTELLLITNMLVYLGGLIAGVAQTGGGGTEAVIDFGHLARTDFHAYQLVTYQFLHDPSSIWHLAFNMLFLWVFGSAVEDRLGRVSFLAFYLIGGAVAGIGHMMLSPNPVIGASGSIAGITGAFLALFPRSTVQVFVLFFIIGVYHVPALWFVALYFVIDLLRQVGAIFGGGGDRVAYMAHLAGYVYGFTLAFVLLATKIVKQEEFDVFYLFKQARRRAAFRTATRGAAGGAWESASADTGARLAKQTPVEEKPPSPEQLAEAAERRAIGGLIDNHDLEGAAARYRTLLEDTPEAVLGEDHQLDLANQLQREADYPVAARAYELLLRSFPHCLKAAEVRLILGIIYARQLERPDRAQELIEAARAGLVDDDQKTLADQLLAELAT
jgi:membrane associated rhomboid family serine protease